MISLVAKALARAAHKASLHNGRVSQAAERGQSSRCGTHRPAATRRHNHRVPLRFANPNNGVLNSYELHLLQNACSPPEPPAVDDTASPTDSRQHAESLFS